MTRKSKRPYRAPQATPAAAMSAPCAARPRRFRLGPTAAGTVAVAGLSVLGLWFASTRECLAGPGDAVLPGRSSDVRFDGQTYTNRLIDSHDPYLLLHAHNPVDWYPWGPEALALAKRENKPIFVSIGYSTCFWCHVAEREIYSDPQIAGLMNQAFVNIKVDREERPDVDRIYMLATQVMTGHGGWPNNVFLTPDLKPFFAGSYFPPRDTDGRPGFPNILAQLQRAWRDDRAKVLAIAEQVYRTLQQVEGGARSTAGGTPDPRSWLATAVRQTAQRFDDDNPGFSGGGFTKFPQEPTLSLLLAAHTQAKTDQALAMASATLQAMAEGGVMDQLGGGFHRYSTEPSWSVPHFEKMLYNNAQLLGLYAEAYAATGKPLFRQVALRTARYLIDAMQAPDGGFYSAEDAEVDHAEGASYVWTEDQIASLLGAADAERWFALYALTPMPPPAAGQKHVEGGVLRLARAKADPLAQKGELAGAIEALAPLRKKLLAGRQRRPQPARDEKIVVADNALTILGFVQAGQALDDPALIRTAARTATWLWSRAFAPSSGALGHQFFHGHAGGDGFLADYALLGRAFLALHRATGEPVWKDRAQQLADALLKRFAQADGSLRSTAGTDGLLIAPPAEGDSTQPSDRSAAVALLLELGAGSGDERYALAAWRALTPLSTQVAAQASNWGALLAVLASPASVATLERARQRAAQLAQIQPNSADFVHADARTTPVPGGFDLTVDLKIEPGHHINANPASDPDLIPTELALSGFDNVRVTYPKAERFATAFAPQGIAVYTGRVQLRARLPKTPAAPATARLRIQVCNDQVCLAPATLDVPLR